MFPDNNDKVFYGFLTFFTVAVGTFGWFIMTVK